MKFFNNQTKINFFNSNKINKENNSKTLSKNFNVNKANQTNFNTNPNNFDVNNKSKSNSKQKDKTKELNKFGSHKQIKYNKEFFRSNSGINKIGQNNDNINSSFKKEINDKKIELNNFNYDPKKYTIIEIDSKNIEMTIKASNDKADYVGKLHNKNIKKEFSQPQSIIEKVKSGKNIPNLNLDNLVNENLRFSFDFESNALKNNKTENIKNVFTKKFNNKDYANLILCNRCKSDINNQNTKNTKNKFSLEEESNEEENPIESIRKPSTDKDINSDNLNSNDNNYKKNLKETKPENCNNGNNSIINQNDISNKNKFSSKSISNNYSKITNNNNNISLTSNKNFEKEILNISNKNINNTNKLNNSSFLSKKKYKEKYSNKFGRLLSSTLGVLLDIIEIYIANKPINTARDSVLKTNPNNDNISYSIDIYESSYNCEEDRRNILIEQIQSLIISKLKFMQTFSRINLDKEIFKVKSWNGILNKDNYSLLSNMSNTKLIMMRKENKEKDVSYTSCNKIFQLIFF